ncbi:SMP-30/gluconolactonase/LRE family protein [Clavibacter phaseoli]|nr:SMP-30/gluconolactonase/LRE family protein [Clavibacter phaseoli]
MVVLVGMVSACTTTTSTLEDDAPAPAPSGTAQTAERLVQVVDARGPAGGVLLEGPTFAPDGRLYVVDVMAPAGEPKVLRVDTEGEDVEAVYTDDASAFTSAQFSPLDGRLYLTDIAGGSITSITPDGDDPRTFFTGDVDGQRLSADDIAFDEDGNLFVSDFTAFPGVPVEAAASGGRVVRIDGRTAEASVLAKGLASPNGISFTEDWSGLWVSQYAANRVDLLGLDEGRTAMTSLHPGVYVSAGSAQIDSNAVDADGNLYQAFEGAPRLDVHAPDGRVISTVAIPEGEEGLSSATNLAIRYGTTEGYMTVSGPAGGFVYRFDALGEGTRQSNGG